MVNFCIKSNFFYLLFIVGRELGRISPVATIVIFALLSFVAGVLTLWLPETKGMKLADTIEEQEELGKNQKWYSCSSKPM